MMMKRYRSLAIPLIFSLLLIAPFHPARLVAQDNASPDATAPPTDLPTVSPSPTPLPTPTPTETATPIPTAALLSPTAFITGDSDLTATAAPPIPSPTADSPTATAETPLETPSPDPLATAPMPEATLEDTPTRETSATLPTVESPAATLTVTPDDTPTLVETSTETPTAGMATFQGYATYQNRPPDQAGIRVRIFNGSEALLTTAVTDPTGYYQVAAPAGEFFWLVIDAPRHRPFRIGVWPGETLPTVELAGGDLDGDGCVGAADLALLSAYFSLPDATATDITNDGLTDAVDLAILAGNLQSGCPADSPTSTMTPTQEAAAVLPEPSPTLEPTPTAAAPETPMPTIEPAVTASATLTDIPALSTESTDG